MQLDINGKEHTLHFGLDFIEELDKKFIVKSNGAEFGMGVNISLSYLKQENPRILVDLIHAATSTENTRPGITEIKRWVEQLEDLEWLFEGINEELGKQPMTKRAVAKMQKAMEEAEAAGE